MLRWTHNDIMSKFFLHLHTFFLHLHTQYEITHIVLLKNWKSLHCPPLPSPSVFPCSKIEQFSTSHGHKLRPWSVPLLFFRTIPYNITLGRNIKLLVLPLHPPIQLIQTNIGQKWTKNSTMTPIGNPLGANPKKVSNQ